MKIIKLFFMGVAITLLPSISYSDEHGVKNNTDCHKKHQMAENFDGDHFLEKMTEKLDLKEDQVSAIKKITEKYKAVKKDKRHHMRGFLKLDPDNENYMEEVEKFAKEKAALVEAKIIRRAQMRVAIHGVLTAEQKEKITNLHGMMRMGTPHR